MNRGHMKNFPHLNETSFPNIDTVDVYAFQNTFDYTRWSENSRIRLVNVIWNSDYSDVVKFDSDVLRDAYFDAISDNFTVDLVQAARIAPDKTIKLPIPYDVLARYNYLYVDMPIATSADAPIDYENSSGILRWYYFIDDIVYLSPNSTAAFLTMDVWTNFQNRVEIDYLMLERGHAPVAYSDTDTYLQNPIANNEYLLAPDVNFDNSGITRHSDYVPFGNGVKYVCFASSVAPEQIQYLGTVTDDSAYAPTGQITYSDVDARYGYQLQVNGFTVGNGKNYGDARTPSKVGQSTNNLIPNNLAVYAIPASECYSNGTFFADILAMCPQFLNTIKACFVVDENCLSLGDSYTIAGHTVRVCNGTKRNLFTKQLTQNDFNYPAEYRRFAKLYTSPYAVLEVTDNSGTTFTINIEETSTVQVKSVVSVAFPFIDYRVYLDGIGGVGSSQYLWADLSGTSSSQEISNSDWFKYCFDWKIPTFALYMDGETAYQLATFNRNTRMGINNALVAYHNTMRSANTAMENARNSADNTLTNVGNSARTAKQNSYNSADTGKTNADNSADTMKTNVDACADTTYTNLDNSCNTMRTNLNLAMATTATLEENAITAGFAQTYITTDASQDNVGHANTAIVVTTGEENKVTTGTNTNNQINSVISGTAGGVAGGAGAGAGFGATIGSAFPVVGTGIGAAAGALIGALGGGFFSSLGGAVSALFGSSNASIITQANQTVADATQQANVAQANTNAAEAYNLMVSNEIQKRLVYTKNNELSDAQMTNNNANDRTNGNNTRTTDKNNATRSRDTAKTNAENTCDTTKTNADNVYDTDITNAQNTSNTIYDNSGYTREIEMLNAKEILENAAANAMAGLNDARNASPISFGSVEGDAAPDYMQNRGVQIKVKTQSDSAIRQTGDTFARYGYALNQVWNVASSGLKLMRHFTYWKASEIWVDDGEASNNSVQSTITEIFMNGVTIWNNPTEIGRVNIYDN